MKINKCPKCGGTIKISPEYGGRGTGEITTYKAWCVNLNCDYEMSDIVVDGTKRSAIRYFNKKTKNCNAIFRGN